MEALLADYDTAPIDVLTNALRIALDAPTLEWAALVNLADWPHERREALLEGERSALDDLAAELNELRNVAQLRP